MTTGVKIKEARVLVAKDLYPFRLVFGKEEHTDIPMVYVAVRVEDSKDNSKWGYSQDFVTTWFKKGSLEDFTQKYLSLVADAATKFKDAFKNKPLHPLRMSHEIGDYLRDLAEKRYDLNALSGQGALSLLERAALDATGRLYEMPAVHLLTSDHIGSDLLGDIDKENLKEFNPTILFRKTPAERLYIRHTVGHTDPLKSEQIQGIEGENNVSLEYLIKNYGLSAFKIKVDGSEKSTIKKEIERLVEITDVIEKTMDTDYIVTLDGNETFDSWEKVKEFASQLLSNHKLENFRKHILYLEEPCERGRIYDTQTISQIQTQYELPLLIDERGGTLDSYRHAIDAGIKGTSLKLCKTVLHSIVDAATVYRLNGNSFSGEHFISAEDLTVSDKNFLEYLIFYGSLHGICAPELNGFVKTDTLTGSTEEERQAFLDLKGSHYRRGNGGIVLVPDKGGYFKTQMAQDIGFGGPIPFDHNPNYKRMKVTRDNIAEIVKKVRRANAPS